VTFPHLLVAGEVRYIVFKERGIHNCIEVLFKMSQSSDMNFEFYSDS
jgi:hypothetical protein